MIFRQLTQDDLGCASYLIGDEKAGVAAVVDPQLHIDGYLSVARYLGVSIGHILETHSKLARLADPDQPIVIAGRDDDDAKGAVELAAAVGIHKVGGYLAGGMTSWREEKRSVEGIERVDVEGLHERLDADGELQILDVRERSEWESGRIPGSLFTPYHDIHELPDGLDAQRPMAAICGSGQRGAVAASLLQRFGAQQVLHVVEGGVPKWGKLGYRLEKPGRS